MYRDSVNIHFIFAGIYLIGSHFLCTTSESCFRYSVYFCSLRCNSMHTNGVVNCSRYHSSFLTVWCISRSTPSKSFNFNEYVNE